MARALHTILVLCLSLVLACAGGSGNESNDARSAGSGAFSPNTIEAQPQASLPGISQGFVVDSRRVRSSEPTRPTAGNKPFTFILFPPNTLPDAGCSAKLPDGVVGANVIWALQNPAPFGDVLLIDPLVNPFALEFTCIGSSFDPQLSDGTLTTAHIEVQPLTLTSRLLIPPDPIREDIRRNKGVYFLLVLSPNNPELPFRFQRPENGAFRVPGLLDEYQSGQDVEIKLLKQISFTSFEIIPTAIVPTR